MIFLRLNKMLNPKLSMGFSKLKMNPLGSKIMPGGLKAAPNGLNKPPMSKITQIMPQKESIKKQTSKSMPNQQIFQNTQTQVDAPVYKQKHPVITIMGHVDHGKTSLIDYLRKSDIAQKEDGGITQRIGAFRINCLGKRITFIDTPGHEAFVNMRQRGASVTDLVVLVVSAAEGVKKQTIQVINLIKKLEIPVIVAINKIDLPHATPEQTENQLQKAGLNLQINGGNVPVVHISAKEGINIDLLCQLIIQQTKNATAIFNGMAEASVLEASQTKQGLNSMTVIIQKGVIKINSILILKKTSFKVKTILDDRGQFLKQAFPGQAVQIVGIPFVPTPGDHVFQVQNQKKAKFLLQQNKNKFYEESRSKNDELKVIQPAKIRFENRKQKRAFCRGVRQLWMNKFADQEQKMQTQLDQLRKQQGNEVIDLAIMELEQKLQNHKKYVYQYLKNTGDSPNNLNFIIKFGDRGMQQTILLQLEKLKPSIELETKVKLNLIKTDVGDVTVSDIQQAKSCSAKIFTFGSGVSSQVSQYSQSFQPPRTHKLIHNLLKDLKQVSFAKKLSSIKGVQRAKSEIAQVFKINLKKKQAIVPGIKILSGKITRKCKAYIFRNGIPVSDALDITFLKAFKKQMTQLKKGQQGTIGFLQEVTDLTKGDQIVFYQQF